LHFAAINAERFMIEINLLSDRGLKAPASIPEAAAWQPSLRFMRLDSGAIALLILALLLIARISIHQIRAPAALERMTLNLVDAESDLAQIARRHSMEERLRLERDTLVHRIDHLEQLVEDREQWPMVWRLVSEALPPGMALRSFEELSAPPAFRMRLQGVALEDGSIGAVVERLSAMEGVRNVRLLQVEASDASTGVHDFQLEVAG
jgi:hypothetical protein